MNDYWHIPRASLSPSSASSAVSSASSTQRSHRSKPTPTHYRRQQQPQYNQQLPPTSSSSASPRHHQTHLYGGRAAGGSRRDSEMSSPHHTTNPSAVMANNKRGSRSSQGSNDSNNSTRSAASGSLLLTAANLERMTEIHRKQHKHQNHQRQQQQQQQHNTHLPIVSASANVAPSSIYSANLIHATSRNGHDYQLATVSRDYDYRTAAKASLPSEDHVDNAAAVVGSAGGPNSVIDIDPNLNFIKTKDLDTVSIASSMHFTMVNGEAGANKKTKKGLCDRGRQVTVLIISMSTIFLLLIMGMVYALEMRAREMPQS